MTRPLLILIPLALWWVASAFVHEAARVIAPVPGA